MPKNRIPKQTEASCVIILPDSDHLIVELAGSGNSAYIHAVAKIEDVELRNALWSKQARKFFRKASRGSTRILKVGSKRTKVEIGIKK